MRRKSAAVGRAPRIASILILMSVLLGLSCSKPRPPARNLVILMVDTLRADHLGYHGHARATSPNLDRFAERSVAFMNHQSHASRTGPSVASLFTGLNVRSHGVLNPLERWNAKGVLDDSRLTLAEILTQAGFRCRAVVANPNVSHRFGFSQGFEKHLQVRLKTPAGPISQRAARWIDQLGDERFFLYVHYMDPHSPYYAPSGARKLFVDPQYQGPITGDHKQIDHVLSGELSLAEADRRHLEALYDQEIVGWDYTFGRFFQFLEERGRLADTVVVVVADHGEEFFEHGGVLHGYTLFQEQLHVPLLIYAPGIEPRQVNSVTRNIDVLPSVLDLLGVPVPPGIQGQSLTPLMKGRPEPDRVVLGEAQLRAVKTVQSRSFRSGNWKLIETFIPKGVPPQLFDLESDPGERRNLYDSRPDVAARISAELEQMLESTPEAPGSYTVVDDETLEQLRQLGYVEPRSQREASGGGH